MFTCWFVRVETERERNRTAQKCRERGEEEKEGMDFAKG
jgi:hypothetical protein